MAPEKKQVSSWKRDETKTRATFSAKKKRLKNTKKYLEWIQEMTKNKFNHSESTNKFWHQNKTVSSWNRDETKTRNRRMKIFYLQQNERMKETKKTPVGLEHRRRTISITYNRQNGNEKNLGRRSSLSSIASTATPVNELRVSSGVVKKKWMIIATCDFSLMTDFLVDESRINSFNLQLISH